MFELLSNGFRTVWGYIVVFILIIVYFIKKIIECGCEKSNTHLDRIIDNIYLGNWHDSVDGQKLKYNNIKCMLTLNWNNEHTKDNKNMFSNLGIKYKYIKIQDSLSADILPHVDESIKFIKKRKNNV